MNITSNLFKFHRVKAIAGGSSDGLARQDGEMLLENEYEILESELNALSDAVRASGAGKDLDEQIRSAAEAVRPSGEVA